MVQARRFVCTRVELLDLLAQGMLCRISSNVARVLKVTSPRASREIKKAAMAKFAIVEFKRTKTVSRHQFH